MANFQRLVRRGFRSFWRVFPRCNTLSQAIAFNLFLAFFPTLLIAVGFATSRVAGKNSLLDMVNDFTNFLPPGSKQIVSEFLVRRASDAWKLALLGWGFTLFAGTQVMKLLIDGIHAIYDDTQRPGFLQRQARSLLLLLVTVAPMLGAAILGIFGRPLRHWLGFKFGMGLHMQGWWSVFFSVSSILLATIALTVIYRVARPRDVTLRDVLPGAIVATLLWWLVDLLFGLYVRRVPYGPIYGGLAAVIGLLIWMQISAVIIFLGAAWNAERALETRKQ